MKDIIDLESKIIERLKPLNPHRIILFGSHAYGNPTSESDYDLSIITNDNFIPENREEKREISKKYTRALRDL